MSKKVKGIPAGTSVPAYNEKNLSYVYTEDQMRTLSGKIQTIIDGAIVDERQNKAIKDQIRHEIWQTISNFQNKASDGKWGHGVKL